MARPLVYGHRGASADAPENTLAAFALAREQGADGVELDVRRTRDGSMALAHDAELPDGRLICELDAAELPAAMPSLEAALDVCAGMIVNIEIKNVSVDPDYDPECLLADQVVGLLARRGWQDRVVVSCFGMRTVDRVRALAPQVPTAFLTMGGSDVTSALTRTVEHGHRVLHPWNPLVDADLVAAAHRAGVAVNVWTVDDPDRIRELAAFGVAGIVTNQPAVALAALGG